LRPAVFLDRDGTVAEEVGYLNHLSRFRLLAGVGPAIRRLNQASIPIVVITTNRGWGGGIFRNRW
jgi:D-glycero-D-manno-heptose 1,7-bisphosphate phosphatase